VTASRLKNNQYKAHRGAGDEDGWWVGFWDGSVTVIYVIVYATFSCEST
jgi:hypothetical protein